MGKRRRVGWDTVDPKLGLAYDAQKVILFLFYFFFNAYFLSLYSIHGNVQ